MRNPLIRGEGHIGGAVRRGRLTDELRAVEIDPNDASAHWNLAITLSLMGQLDEALISLRKAVELEPDWAQKARDAASFASLHDRDDFWEIVGGRPEGEGEETPHVR